MKPTYYSEFDPKAAAWLRELIKGGHIPAGDVDERDLWDVRPDDLRPYGSVHLCAGIGGWALALRLAGVPDDRHVWTASFPCQPFSEAGARRGLDDERHLWPAGQWLIAQCRPQLVFGEQVEAAIRYGWLDLVQDDLEALGYAFAATGLPAACVGAPHIRQRLWWVADTGSQRQQQHAQRDGQSQQPRLEAPRGPDADGRGQLQLGVTLGDAERTGLAQRLGLAGVPGWALGTGARQAPVGAGIHADAIGRLDLAPGGRCERGGHQPAHGVLVQADAFGGFWSNAVWIDCRDGKRRPIEPSIFPLASRVPHRVGLLRGSGNSIVPQVAAAFIEEYFATRRAIP